MMTIASLLQAQSKIGLPKWHFTVIMFYSFLYFWSVQQVFTEKLLCSRCHYRYLGYNSAQNRQVLRGAHILERGQALDRKMGERPKWLPSMQSRGLPWRRGWWGGVGWGGAGRDRVRQGGAQMPFLVRGQCSRERTETVDSTWWGLMETGVLPGHGLFCFIIIIVVCPSPHFKLSF